MAKHFQSGFMQFAIVILIAILVLTLAGFDIRNSFSPDKLQSQAQSVISFAERTYDNHIAQYVNRFIITPAKYVWRHIRSHIVQTIIDMIQTVLNNDPFFAKTTIKSLKYG